MREGIHPEYNDVTVNCVCGATYTTKSTKSFTKIDICANCHPFYTGKQKVLDTEGRIERFRKKFGTDYTQAAKAHKEAKLEKANAKNKNLKKK